jgi:hypothetical protein
MVDFTTLQYSERLYKTLGDYIGGIFNTASEHLFTSLCFSCLFMCLVCTTAAGILNFPEGAFPRDQ